MPYKHIAAKLKKTELACRLHYHQLSFGNKRRRRTTSVTSFASIGDSPVSAIEHLPHHSLPQRPLPSFSPPGTPERRYVDSNEISATNRNTPQAHKPILPKPFSAPPSSSASSRPSLSSTKGLRLITEDIEDASKKPLVDISRLDRIYDAHRLHFWSIIARSYGCNLSPAALEEAWCRAHTLDPSRELPPTPIASPHESSVSSAMAKPVFSAATEKLLGAPFTAVAEYSKGFTAINGDISRGREMLPTPKSAVDGRVERERGTFAISSLLTEDKEVRSPG